MRAWEDFQKTFKTLKRDAKKIKPADGEKIKRALKSELTRAWDAEDGLRDAIPKAKEAGIEGKKPADFLKDGGFKSAHDGWRAACKAHKHQIGKIKDHCDSAGKLQGAVAKAVDDLERALKKAKTKPTKEMDAAIKEAANIAGELKKSKDLYGSLKFAEVFYAAREDRALEAMVKKALKKSDAAGLPKDLDEKGRSKTLTQAQKLGKKIASLCKAVEGGGRNAAKAEKSAKGELKTLTSLNDASQKAASAAIKKNTKSPEVKPLRKFMKDMATQARAASKQVEGLPST